MNGPPKRKGRLREERRHRHWKKTPCFIREVPSERGFERYRECVGQRKQLKERYHRNERWVWENRRYVQEDCSSAVMQPRGGVGGLQKIS